MSYVQNCHALGVRVADDPAYHAAVAALIARHNALIASVSILDETEAHCVVQQDGKPVSVNLSPASVKAVAAEVATLVTQHFTPGRN